MLKLKDEIRNKWELFSCERDLYQRNNLPSGYYSSFFILGNFKLKMAFLFLFFFLIYISDQFMWELINH